MPEFTISVPQKAVDRLQQLVARYNDNTGSSLTLRDWLTLHLKEMAVQAEMAESASAIRRQQELEANQMYADAVKAEQDRLIAGLED
jgi:aminoglycoside phosphotransferase (APT) family kinase protein